MPASPEVPLTSCSYARILGATVETLMSSCAEAMLADDRARRGRHQRVLASPGTGFATVRVLEHPKPRTGPGAGLSNPGILKAGSGR